MMMKYIATTTLTSLLFFSASTSAATTTNNLRGQQEQPTKERILSIQSTLLDSITSAFSTELEQTAQNAFGSLNDQPITLPAGDDTISLEDVEIPLPDGSTCEVSANVTIVNATISGLDTFQLDSLDLQDDTGDVNIDFFSQSATFSGTWVLSASFTNITVESTIILSSQDNCNVNGTTTRITNETLSGITTYNEPSVTMSIAVEGEVTNNLQDITITNAEIEDLDFAVGSITTELQMQGGSNTIATEEFSSDAIISLVSDELSNEVESELLNVLNSAIEDELPISFSV